MSRTDGDTWDLASSVGATATAVAASRALASQGDDALLDDRLADPLVRAVGVDTFIKLIDGELPAADDRAAAPAADPAMNRQTMREAITVRTRYFDDFFLAASAAGVRQAVILASGLDTRAYRLRWPAGTVVYEIDQPQVIEFKTRVLDELGAAPAADLRTVRIDLRDDWPAALRASGFDPSAPTAWIAEGLLIYLPPEAQDALLDNITELSAPGSRLATEHMDAGSLPADWAQRLSERSKRFGSDIDLAELFYLEDRRAAGDYLSERGWQTTITSTDDAFAAHGFSVPDDELRALVSTSGYLTATLP
ncbi:SAM-dependent methyltransferase [Mycobacterium sp. 852013-51886_SCH5428379]|uniref:SAM-dependent methyltransferase n=1 Tax=Mycobacterium sp. 852013-51886_SCH5428379 TaxID=1834111 RepID=UPI0007FF6FD8|nr:SAM-dependent methyltransferase [Mycobacterium sp. 852013-51886_SCH5428379]OBB57255.1 SAM-dependent methyltransferase [Mycobacterium sp. 852013-51886_SCH5428379]